MTVSSARPRYFFDLAPVDDEGGADGHLTLFIPRGWHHWLLADAAWHVVFGGSHYGADLA